MKTRSRVLAFILALAALAVGFASVAGSKSTRASLTTTLTVIAAKPSNLSGYNFANPNTSIVYIQLFDAASASGITLGTTAPAVSIAVPAVGVTDSFPTSGVAFQLGIVAAATTTATGSTAPTSNVPSNFYTN